VPVGADVFDTHPHLLNCPNGTVDLRTGELRPHRRGDHLTKICPTRFDPGAAAPTYREFLGGVFPSAAVAGYVRELSGLAVTGEVTDQTLHLFHGSGGNGKGVLLDLWIDVLGDGEFAATVPAELVADGGKDRHPTEKTLLRGARLAVCQESGEDERLNAKRVKNLTGGSRVVARGMRQDFYSFPPTHTLILATNHLPRVRTNDHATWRRIRVIGFPHTYWTEADRKANPGGNFPEDRRADADLTNRLRAEAEGVLADMAAHAVAFYANGRRLTPPDEVVRAGINYRTSEDTIGRFFRECVLPDPRGRGVRGAAFYQEFKQWYLAEIDPDGAESPGARTFYEAAAERFGEPRKVGGYMTYAVRLSRIADGTGRSGAGEDGEG
jgi:putative DNA primase/helicase